MYIQLIFVLKTFLAFSEIVIQNNLFLTNTIKIYLYRI